MHAFLQRALDRALEVSGAFSLRLEPSSLPGVNLKEKPIDLCFIRAKAILRGERKTRFQIPRAAFISFLACHLAEETMTRTLCVPVLIGATSVMHS